MNMHLDAIGITVNLNDFHLSEKKTVSLSSEINNITNIEDFTATPLPRKESDDDKESSVKIEGISKALQFFLSDKYAGFLFHQETIKDDSLVEKYFEIFNKIMKLVLNEEFTANSIDLSNYYLVEYKTEREAQEKVFSILNKKIIGNNLSNANLQLIFDVETQDFKNLHHNINFEIIGKENIKKEASDDKKAESQFNTILLESNVHTHIKPRQEFIESWDLNRINDFMKQVRMIQNKDDLASKFML